MPSLNAWIIWWNADSLVHGFENYWNAPIFAPNEGSFALSEPQPLTVLLSPIVYLTGSPVLAYNSYVLISLALNGLFACRFLRLAGSHRVAEVAGGVAVVLHPLAINGLEAVQLLSLWPVLWTLESLLRFRQEQSGWQAAKIGIGITLTASLCLYHALFFGILLVACAWTIWPRESRLRFFEAAQDRKGDAGKCDDDPKITSKTVSIGVLIAAGVIALTVLPFVWQMQRIHDSYSLSRNPAAVAALSASWTDWGTTPANALFQTRSIEGGGFALLPGIGRLVAALLTVALCFHRKPRFVLLLATLGIFGLLFSLGVNLSLGSLAPWQWLSEHVGLIARIRSPYRFAYFTQITILLLAAYGLGELLRSLGSLFVGRSSTVVQTVVGVIGFAVIAFEVPPEQSLLYYPPHPAHKESWVDFVAKETPQGRSILCLPVASDISETANQRETTWMMYGTIHKIPLLNGYSGFSPPSWSKLRRTLATGALQSDTLEIAFQGGAYFVVIRKDRYSDSDLIEVQRSEYYATEFEDERYLIVSNAIDR